MLKHHALHTAWLSYFRSPWSNKYDPPTDDGIVPSDGLRKVEVQANEAFDTYREMYVVCLFDHMLEGMLNMSVSALGTSRAAYRPFTCGIRKKAAVSLASY